MKKFRTVTGLAVAAFVAAACTGTPNSKAAPSPSGIAHFYAQHVSWKDCGGGFQCGTLHMPLDYARPDGARITMSVLRLPAEGQRKGSLLINPGGPGGSGVQFVRDAARQYGADLRKNFDLVGFDPRGVGHSTEVQCVSPKDQDELYGETPDPVSDAQFNEIVTDTKQAEKPCGTKYGAQLALFSTE
ncbi:MAG TPA: hypothetical protein VGO89_08675, partial [Streptomyces sp.]|nr:hypothetical protein [Streptomyces sp.]